MDPTTELPAWERIQRFGEIEVLETLVAKLALELRRSGRRVLSIKALDLALELPKDEGYTELKSFADDCARPYVEIHVSSLAKAILDRIEGFAAVRADLARERATEKGECE